MNFVQISGLTNGQTNIMIDVTPLLYPCEGLCSHRRSYYYYLHSILEPKLFPSLHCATVEDCNNQVVDDSTVTAYMGESAPDYYQG